MDLRLSNTTDVRRFDGCCLRRESLGYWPDFGPDRAKKREVGRIDHGKEPTACEKMDESSMPWGRSISLCRRDARGLRSRARSRRAKTGFRRGLGRTAGSG